MLNQVHPCVVNKTLILFQRFTYIKFATVIVKLILIPLAFEWQKFQIEFHLIYTCITCISYPTKVLKYCFYYAWLKVRMRNTAVSYSYVTSWSTTVFRKYLLTFI
jgi:hypothetical protein